MNQQTDQASATAVRKRPVGRPERAKWVAENRAVLNFLQRIIVVLCAAVLLLGVLILLLPAFRVRNVIVEGNTGIVTKEQIRDAAGVLGKEIVGLDLNAVEKRVTEQYPNIGIKKISATPSSVRIVVEPLAVMYFSFVGKWFSLDSDLRVLALSEDESAFRGLQKVELPAVKQLSVGKKIEFVNGEIDRAYIGKMLDLLGTPELAGRVDLLNVSEKFNVSFVLDGRIRIVIGKVDDLNNKLEMAATLIGQAVGADEFVIVDVTDPTHASLRKVTENEFLAG